MRNASKAGVGLYLFLLLDVLSGDGKDDDEGVMCWWNGCSSLCFFLLFLYFPVGCLSLVTLPLFLFFFFSLSFRSTEEAYI
jgi:hypothetical protein